MARTPLSTRSVLTLGAPPEGRGAALTTPERPPAFGVLDLEAIARLKAELSQGLSSGGMLVPGEDAAFGVRERQGGRALAELLQGPGMREIEARLGLLGAAAAVRQAPLDLLLDLRGGDLWGLPWELLELLPEGEPLGGCRVARIVEGAGLVAEPGERLEVLVWSPTPADPDCARVLEALEGCLARAPRLRRVDAAEAPGAGRIVHVVCHGGERGEPVLELGRDRHLDAATLGRVLEPVIRGAALVVLDVCGAAGAEEPAALPAWRVVSAGASACLAPRAALDVEASIAMSEALYGALSDGAPLLTSVRAGRRAVAALGLPDPSARWWSLTLVTAEPAILDLAPLRPRRLGLPELDRGDPEATALLERALALATPQGFLGLEHLALAMSRANDLPPLVAVAQPHLLGIAARAAGYQPTGQGGVPLTPRLKAALDALPEGFDLVALLRMMASSRPSRLDAPGLVGLLRELGPLSSTLSGEGPPRARAPAGPSLAGGGVRLEVIGGPEDGLARELGPLRPVLGRWDPLGAQPDVSVLFAGSGATDLSVSRRHLRWIGGAEVEALAATGLRRGPHLEPILGIVALRRGDLLELGHVTRLEVLDVPP